MRHAIVLGRMKRLVMLLLAACMLLSAAGCKRAKSYKTALPCNPTTGYDWVLDEAAPETDHLDRVLVQTEYVQNAAAKGRAGAGGERRITVSGISPGEATVRLYYVRSWEWDGDPATATGQAVYSFTVGEDLSVEFGGASLMLPESLS